MRPAVDPFAQEQYQVRFDWGIQGADTIARDADVIVVVDVLSFCTTVDLRLAGGDTEVSTRPLERLEHHDGARIAAALDNHTATVVAGSLRNPAAIAAWAVAQQGDKGDRFRVAVIAAGEARRDDTTRVAVEDQLGAGAIIDALAEAGIDYCSPEAAAAAASFTGLRNATGHLIGASASGRQLAADGARSLVDRAIELNASGLVPTLRESSFRA